MSSGPEYIPQQLYDLADEVEADVTHRHALRNYLLGLAVVSEIALGIADLAGANYASSAPYYCIGTYFLTVIGMSYGLDRHDESMANSFREGARIAGVMDTYTNPEDWEGEYPNHPTEFED